MSRSPSRRDTPPTPRHAPPDEESLAGSGAPRPDDSSPDVLARHLEQAAPGQLDDVEAVLRAAEGLDLSPLPTGRGSDEEAEAGGEPPRAAEGTADPDAAGAAADPSAPAAPPASPAAASPEVASPTVAAGRGTERAGGSDAAAAEEQGEGEDAEEEEEEDEPRDAASLVVRHLPEVTAFCFSRTGDWSMAEEAAQEAMVNVIRAEARCPFDAGPEEVRGWVMEIARGVCVDVLRRRAVASQEAIDPRERLERRSRERSGVTPSVGRPVVFQDVEERSPRLVAALQEPARSVVKLRLWDQRSFEEIASALGKSPDAVMTLYAEALRDLDAAITAEEQGGGGAR